MHCGRPQCITCNQGAEILAPCSRKSVIYENICSECNPGAGEKEEIKGCGDPEKPSIYVGETSRSIQERGREHWSASTGSNKAKEGSHMAKHVELEHQGEQPKFILRAVQYYKTALARQTGEAVRIRRRGGEGAVLNSRSEFNRCFIPRLRVIGEEEISEMEEQDRQVEQDMREELQDQEEQWARTKTVKRSGAAKSRDSWVGSSKRVKESNPGRGRPSKKRRYVLVESDWGVKTTSGGTKTTLERLANQDCQEDEVYGVGESQEDYREDPGGVEASRIPGQDLPERDPDYSPPGVGGDPPPPTQPSYGGGMDREEQTMSPDTDVKGGPSPIDKQSCPGGTMGHSGMNEPDAMNRVDTFDDMPRYGQEDAGCMDMTVVDTGDTMGDNEYDMRTSMGGQDRTDAALLLPSSGQSMQHKKARPSGAVLDVNAKCVMKNSMCVTHDCIVKRIKMKDKRWGYIHRKKQYGWIYSSRTRLVCSGGGDTSITQDGLPRDDLTGGISAVFGLGGQISSKEIPLVEEENVELNEEL